MKIHNMKLSLLLFSFLLLLAGMSAVAQQPPAERPPVNVAGKWTIYSKSDDGRTATKSIDLKQNGNTITGHFKGPFQSGSLEGTVNGRHIFFYTKTRQILRFRGMVDGDSMQGTFHIRGQAGEWQARRSN